MLTTINILVSFSRMNIERIVGKPVRVVRGELDLNGDRVVRFQRLTEAEVATNARNASMEAWQRLQQDRISAERRRKNPQESAAGPKNSNIPS
jgi:hypothetical protein